MKRLRPVFTRRQRLVNWLLIAMWGAGFVYFWQWWLRPEHFISFGRHAVTTLLMLWVTLLPAYFIMIVAFARKIPPRAQPPRGLRVAIVVTKAPSEPFEVVRKTLEGALAQQGVEHDTWLADEAPDRETLAWCKKNGVKVSSRQGVAQYQRDDWPRRKKCKEGNLAYFYDRHGYEGYDVVTQFDADHVPKPGYLRHAVPAFADPAVGYVSAPSICDVNAGQCWAARGRLYLEGSMHGALQSGYTNGWAPLCIGSHYTVRTAALRSIGGLGPELAEDHSTTLLLSAAGWRGVHAIDSIAHGELPPTIGVLMHQEFQWSRSLMTIFLKYMPALFGKLTWRLRLQFVFAQLWFPLYSLTFLVMFLMPLYALHTGVPFLDVTFLGFVLHILPSSIAFTVIALWWRRAGIFRPVDARIISWEGFASILARWPFMLAGAVMAIVDMVRGKVAGFVVTPKGDTSRGPLPLRAIMPYLVLSAASGLAAWFIEAPLSASGFYIFALYNALVYLGLSWLILWRHAVENDIAVFSGRLADLPVIAMLALSLVSIAGAGYQNGLAGLTAFNSGNRLFSIAEFRFPASGAGRIASDRPIIVFAPRWHGLGDEQIPPIDPAGN